MCPEWIINHEWFFFFGLIWFSSVNDEEWISLNTYGRHKSERIFIWKFIDDSFKMKNISITSRHKFYFGWHNHQTINISNYLHANEIDLQSSSCVISIGIEESVFLRLLTHDGEELKELLPNQLALSITEIRFHLNMI